MNFFSNLSKLMGDEYSLEMSIALKKEKLSVSVIPKTNALKKDFQPVLITGTPDELDGQFISAIAEPVKELNSLVVSAKTFVKEEKAKSTKKEDKSKEEPVKEDKPKEPEKNPDTSKLDFDSPEPEKEPVEELVDQEPEEEETAETFSETTGEVFPDSVPPEQEEELPIAPEPESNPDQTKMFDDEEW